MKNDDVLMRALNFSNQCKTHLSFIIEAEGNELSYLKITSESLVNSGVALGQELHSELKNSGWWKKKVINSWILDTQKWVEQIIYAQALLEAKYD